MSRTGPDSTPDNAGTCSRAIAGRTDSRDEGMLLDRACRRTDAPLPSVLSRRAWLKATGRWLVLALVTAGSAWLLRRGGAVGQARHSGPNRTRQLPAGAPCAPGQWAQLPANGRYVACASCPALAGCMLPPAVYLRRGSDRAAQFEQGGSARYKADQSHQSQGSGRAACG